LWSAERIEANAPTLDVDTCRAVEENILGLEVGMSEATIVDKV
jgi:hypothetical protein